MTIGVNITPAVEADLSFFKIRSSVYYPEKDVIWSQNRVLPGNLQTVDRYQRR